jgi:hypothetical protein
VYGILEVNCGLLMIIINSCVVCWRIDLILELLISWALVFIFRLEYSLIMVFDIS